MTSVMPTTIIRASSGATGVSAVTPFYWIRDKLVYQQWQIWSEQARHAAAADCEASKVHYFYNWIGAGTSAIEGWKRKGALTPQEKYDKLKEGEFYSQAQEIVQRCIFPSRAAEERAIRDALCLGMRSQRVKDKCINFINDGEELTIDFIMKHLEVEDSNSHHKSLSQMDSTTGVNFMSYDHKKGKGKGHEKHNGKENSSAQRS